MVFAAEITITFLAAAALHGCATGSNARVAKTESGKLTAISSSENEPDARIAAVDIADQYCGKRDRSPVFQENYYRDDPTDQSLQAKLKRIPLIGKALEDEGKTQVVLSFRCEDAKG